MIELQTNTLTIDPTPEGLLLMGKFMLLALIPILAWIWFFQRQNHERRKFVILSFFGGMLSVIPIKLYESNWDTSVLALEHINMFQHLADVVHSPAFAKLLAFVSASAIVALGLFLFTALVMSLIEIGSGDNTLRTFRRKCVKIAESPLLFVSTGIIFGLAAFGLHEVLPHRVWFFVVVGMLEEFIKYLFLRFSDEEKIGSVADSISFAIFVALGFAFVENILYLQKFWMTMSQSPQNFAIFFFLRSTFSVVAHVCFSAIIGYFYGVAHFSNKIYRNEALARRHPALRWMHRVLHCKTSTLFHEEMLMEGFLLAMVVHAIFNSLLEYDKTVLLIPFMLLMFFFILQIMHLRTVRERQGVLPNEPQKIPPTNEVLSKK